MHQYNIGRDAISIHAPHARSDDLRAELEPRRRKFQSTLLMRGATRGVIQHQIPPLISIHAPHARSDKAECIAMLYAAISIHAPHARSDVQFAFFQWIFVVFQSTLLMRGATPHR